MTLGVQSRYHDNGMTMEAFAKESLNQFVGIRVNAASWLVEYQDWSILQHCSREAEELELSV